MGMAASQARFLSLTARLSDNEFHAEQIAQERLALANQTEIFTAEYEAATSNEVFVATVYDENGSASNVTLTYDVINKDMMKGGLGMKLVTSAGLVVVPSVEKAAEMGLKDGEFFLLEDITKPDVLKTNLEEGNMFLSQNKDEETGEWIKKSPESLDTISKEYDKTDDAAATALYEKRTKKIEKQDSMMELQLQKLETEHKALETEMDSLQKVIEDNIEQDFKTFA